jgi:hypothetical protein
MFQGRPPLGGRGVGGLVISVALVPCRTMENPNPKIGLGSVLIDQITGPNPLQGTGI